MQLNALTYCGAQIVMFQISGLCEVELKGSTNVGQSLISAHIETRLGQDFVGDVLVTFLTGRCYPKNWSSLIHEHSSR